MALRMDVCECRQMFADAVSVTLADPSGFYIEKRRIFNCTKSYFCAVVLRAYRVVPPHARVAFYVRRKAKIFVGKSVSPLDISLFCAILYLKPWEFLRAFDTYVVGSS